MAERLLDEPGALLPGHDALAAELRDGWLARVGAGEVLAEVAARRRRPPRATPGRPSERGRAGHRRDGQGHAAAAPGEGTRPLADRVKQTLFAILEPDLPGARVLDLFAGSGAGGIEALSRGAAGAVFVERDAMRRPASSART